MSQISTNRHRPRQEEEVENNLRGELLLLEGEVKKKVKITAQATQDALIQVRQKKRRMGVSTVYLRHLQMMEDDLQRILEVCRRMDKRQISKD